MVDKFGLVFQSGALFDSMTVGENVAFGIKNRQDMKRADIDAIVEHSLNQVGLAGYRPICCRPNSAAA